MEQKTQIKYFFISSSLKNLKATSNSSIMATVERCISLMHYALKSLCFTFKETSQRNTVIWTTCFMLARQIHLSYFSHYKNAQWAFLFLYRQQILQKYYNNTKEVSGIIYSYLSTINIFQHFSTF